MPSRTPAGGGFGHARITNAGHTRTARIDTYVDHDVCVMNWNRRHCVRGRCERHGKDNSKSTWSLLFLQQFHEDRTNSPKSETVQRVSGPPSRLSVAQTIAGVV